MELWRNVTSNCGTQHMLKFVAIYFMPRDSVTQNLADCSVFKNQLCWLIYWYIDCQQIRLRRKISEEWTGRNKEGRGYGTFWQKADIHVFGVTVESHGKPLSLCRSLGRFELDIPGIDVTSFIPWPASLPQPRQLPYELCIGRSTLVFSIRCILSVFYGPI